MTKSESNRQRYIKDPQMKQRIAGKLKGNQHTKGMHWKVKDISNYKGLPQSFKKGHPATNKGGYKVKDTSKMGHDTKGEKNGMWKGGLKSLKYKEQVAGRKKPKQCEVCGAIARICFDHNHKTGEFRGWICYRCNVALGMAQDKVEILKLLIKYLEK